MKQFSVLLFIAFILIGSFFLFNGTPFVSNDKIPLIIADSEKKGKQKSAFVKARLQYEFDILKNPVTGKVPSDILKEELKFALTIPLKQHDNSSFLRTLVNNAYQPAGPNNIGGRTRAVVFDKRFGTGSNRVIIAGSVSGGIYRTTDGGSNWIRVTPENELHNITALAQDTRTGFENTWYAGGGEAVGNTASGVNAFYLGAGILKSTDNGVTWTRLTQNVTNTDGTLLSGGTTESFDNVFDIVHKIAVNPVNGHVYICGHRRLIRSENGGSDFKVIFAGNAAATAETGQMDLVSTNTGKLFLAVNGGNPDKNIRGIWTSNTGNFNSWLRFAGGQTTGVDSLNGWRANSYVQTGGNFDSKRILLSLAPSNQNILYAFYENGLSQKSANGAHPEADLFRFTVSTGNPPYPSVNLSSNMPDFPGQTDVVDPLSIQGGYNMLLSVKPDNPNIVFIGGTNLYRSTDGFTSTNNTEWIGGYRKSNPPSGGNYLSSHPDMHNLVFNPTDPNNAVCANDGGLQITNNIGASTVIWSMVTNYQTLQYFHVAINPDVGKNNFLGGAQDNGSLVRTETGNQNNHTQLKGGDGGAVGFGSTGSSSVYYVSSQLGEITRNISNNFTDIKPSGLTANTQGGFGDFVTYFKLDFDNTQNLYYVNFGRIFRTKSAATVTNSTWEELTGVSATVNPANPNADSVSIRALELSRGPYIPSHVLYFGSNKGKLYRLDDPRNANVTTAPTDITPPGMTGNVSDISINPNRDDEILVTVSNYGTPSIWWTNNAKSTNPIWKNVEGNVSLSSARSCMIVVKKDASNLPITEYYVGTSAGLYSTTNISASTVNWVREGGNVLNFAVITSLDYRPQDNTLLVGTHGNGMFFANTGTPNFSPDLSTGINDPVINDKNFIIDANPTLTANRINYTTGNMLNIQKLIITVHNLAGQLTYRSEAGYQNGTIDVSNISKGAYVLTITSSDYTQKFLQRFLKH